MQPVLLPGGVGRNPGAGGCGAHQAAGVERPPPGGGQGGAPGDPGEEECGQGGGHHGLKNVPNSSPCGLAPQVSPFILVSDSDHVMASLIKESLRTTEMLNLRIELNNSILG